MEPSVSQPRRTREPPGLPASRRPPRASRTPQAASRTRRASDIVGCDRDPAPSGPARGPTSRWHAGDGDGGGVSMPGPPQALARSRSDPPPPPPPCPRGDRRGAQAAGPWMRHVSALVRLARPTRLSSSGLGCGPASRRGASRRPSAGSRSTVEGRTEPGRGRTEEPHVTAGPSAPRRRGEGARRGRALVLAALPQTRRAPPARAAPVPGLRGGDPRCPPRATPGRLGRPDAGRGCGPGPAGPRARWSCSPRPAARRPPRALPAQGSEATWEWAGKSASHRRPRNCFAPAFAADSVEGARYVQRRRAKSVVPTNGWCIPRCLRRCLAHLRFAERVGETRTGGPSPAEKGIQVRRNSAARRTGSSLPRPTPEAPAPGRARPGRCRTRARTSVLWGGRPPCRCVGGGLATHRFGTARSPVSPRLCESTRVLPARGSSKAHQASSVGDAPSELPR